MANRYGLSRDIPSGIKRAVRQACGYGCVICRVAIIDYEHIDPEYHEAREHNPSAIALLCPQHHAQRTRGFLSKETVKQAMLNPVCKKQGFASEFFDIGHTQPTLVFAAMTLRNTPIPIQVKGVPLIKIEKAEEIGGPFRLTGNFYNSHGQPSLEILENEWRVRSSNWDVEVVGPVITIRDNLGHISLRLRTLPPDALLVEQLDMFIEGYRVLGNEECLNIVSPGGSFNSFSGMICEGAVGLSLG